MSAALGGVLVGEGASRDSRLGTSSCAARRRAICGTRTPIAMWSAGTSCSTTAFAPTCARVPNRNLAVHLGARPERDLVSESRSATQRHPWQIKARSPMRVPLPTTAPSPW
jgi:hypothetical protein